MSVPTSDVTEVEIPEGKKKPSAIRIDYRNIKHPSEIKLISVVKTQETSGPAEQKWIGLTKFELMEYVDDPFWVKLRQFLLFSVTLTFLILFAVAIYIVLDTPRCTMPENSTHNNLTSSTSIVCKSMYC